MMTHCTDATDLDLDNRRQAPRINRETPVNYLDDAMCVGHTVALNVSATGARLILKRPCYEAITLQFDPHTQVLARPVWSRHLPQFSVVGFEFEVTTSEQRLCLERFLDRLAA